MIARSRNTSWLVLNAAAFLLVSAAVAATSPPATPAFDEPQEYSHAGISLAMPKGYEAVVVGEPFDVLRCELREKGRAVLSVSLWAFPVEPKVTADLYAEAMLSELAHNPAIKNFKAVPRSTMKVASLTGTVARISYGFHGGEVAAVRLYFLREVGRCRLCYVLNLQGDLDRQGELGPLLTELAKTIKLVPLAHPSAASMKDHLGPVEEPRLGLAVRPPRGWYLHLPKGECSVEVAGGLPLVRTGLHVGQMDLADNGESQAQAALIMADVASADDANACPAMMAKACSQLAAGKVTAETAASLLGQAGSQIVLGPPAAEGLPKAEDEPPLQAFTVIRAACLPANDKGAHKAFAIVLQCRSADAAAAAAMMERLASGFDLMPHAASNPASMAATSRSTH